MIEAMLQPKKKMRASPQSRFGDSNGERKHLQCHEGIDFDGIEIDGTDIAWPRRHLVDDFAAEGNEEEQRIESELESMGIAATRTRTNGVRRLVAEGVAASEVREMALMAVKNYAHFYQRSHRSVHICDILRSSAGLRGWAAADVGYVEKVVTLHISGQDADGSVEITCTSAGGSQSALQIAPTATVETFRIALSEKLKLQSDTLRLVMPDARLIDAVDDEMQLVPLLAESGQS